MGKTFWGMETAIDLYGCDMEVMTNADKIRSYVIELCEKIGMKRFGECQVVHFGEDEEVAGYSMTQLISTSLVSAHFINKTRGICLNIFSCKPYDVGMAAQFTSIWFKASGMDVKTWERHDTKP